MGGHAVRFYGYCRNTNDFDLHLASEPWDDLPDRLNRGLRIPIVEGPSWRTTAFRRFRIGALADGSDEWLEFCRFNHLLAPHEELMQRSQSGNYGGQIVRFLGLQDLIRSEETERDKDWQDISKLEEFHDAQLLLRVERAEIELSFALAAMRSRAGFGTALLQGKLSQESEVRAALSLTRNPITQAFLIPFSPQSPLRPDSLFAIEPVVLERLKNAPGGSTFHLSLVEVIRRRYVALCKSLDRRDKEAIQAQPRMGP